MVYLLNRTVNFSTSPVTTFEKFYKTQPQIGHVRIFGCLAILKAPTKKRSGYQPKLEARGIRGVLVGYEQDFTYRIFNPEKKEIVITRDAIFDEYKSYYGATVSYHALDDCIDTEKGVSGSSVEDDNDVVEPEEVFVSSIEDEPTTYRQAISCSDSLKWIEAMKNEYNSLIMNKTWELCKLPAGRKPVDCKWVYKLKYRSDGTIDRYKARLVARGFSQKYGIDFKETFSPVVRMDSIRLLLSLVVQFNLEMIQLDVKTAFLHGALDEGIYMSQPEGFNQGEHLVCRLTKSLYGLKQASRQWNVCFSTFLQDFDLVPLKSDTCVFVNKGCCFEGGGEILIICIYVDDGLLMSNSKQQMRKCLDHLNRRFEITTSEPSVFVGLQIERSQPRDSMKIHQAMYIRRVVERFELQEAKPLCIPMQQNMEFTRAGVVNVESKDADDVPYQSAIGSLMYASLGTRLDITYTVNVLSRFNSKPKLAHWMAVKRVIRYLIDKADHGIVYHRRDKLSLVCYSDADHAGCQDTMKSTSGFIVMINGSPVIWKSTKQTTVATSTCEAEFVAAAREVLWVRNFLGELGLAFEPSPLFVDNLGTVRLIQNDQTHAKNRHLNIKLHDIRLINKKQHDQPKLIDVKFCPGETQVADILTKALPRERFVKLLNLIGFSGGCSQNMIKTEIAAMALFAIVVTSTSGAILAPATEMQIHRKEVAFSHGCNFIFQDEKMAKKELESHFEQGVVLKPDATCKTWVAWQWFQCARYHSKLVELLVKLPEVARGSRYRVRNKDCD